MPESAPVVESSAAESISAASGSAWAPPKRMEAGEVLRAAGRLFLLTWPGCLPLALLGVVSSGMPGALAPVLGEARGLAHGPTWWLLYGLAVLLMLLFYGAVTLRQQARAEGQALATLAALGLSLRRLPAAAGAALGYLLLSPLLLPVVWLSLAWLLAVIDGSNPLAACRRSRAALRGYTWRMTTTLLSLLAGVLVFVMLTGVFYGVVMVVAGQAGARNGVLISQVVFTALLSLPVIYVSAVLVSCLAVLRRAVHSPT